MIVLGGVRKFTKLLSHGVFGLMLFTSFFLTPALAASNISLSPTTGTYSSDFAVDVNLNTNADAVTGIRIRVNYTGPISFVSGSAGTVTGCTPTYTLSGQSVIIECMIAPLGNHFTGSAKLATLVFRPSDTGSIGLTITIDSIGGSTAGTLTGATYTISPLSGGQGGTLPYTGVFENTLIMSAGAIFLLLCFYVARRSSFNYKKSYPSVIVVYNNKVEKNTNQKMSEKI